LDRWDTDGVRFIFGIDATEALYKRVEELPKNAWKELKRPPKYEVRTRSRQRPENVKQQIVEARQFEDIRLVKEYVAEFIYRPAACKKHYRVSVVRKELEVHRGQQKLFDKSVCFFYINNAWGLTEAAVVGEANDRCNQENLLAESRDF
jgi:hypothetical protein